MWISPSEYGESHVVVFKGVPFSSIRLHTRNLNLLCIRWNNRRKKKKKKTQLVSNENIRVETVLGQIRKEKETKSIYKKLLYGAKTETPWSKNFPLFSFHISQQTPSNHLMRW